MPTYGFHRRKYMQYTKILQLQKIVRLGAGKMQDNSTQHCHFLILANVLVEMI